MSAFHFWWKVLWWEEADVILNTASYKNKEENHMKEAAITLHNHFK